MNKVFAEHVTQTAFFLSVSKKQTHYLAALYHHPWQKDDNTHEGAHYRALQSVPPPANWITSMEALMRKGLVVRVMHDRRRNAGHWELTAAGELTCKLLIEAGLMQERNAEEKAA